MEKLEVRGVSKCFDGAPVLEDISITLRQGELVCLLGVSGGGKTTLFNIISGLVEPDRGQVFLDGEDVTGKPGRISYMLQKDLLLPYRTIQDNVALPLLLRGEKKREARAKAAELFPEFGLEGTERKYPAQLSGGMRQRAALLRTYLFSQNVALLDEPFSALDYLTRVEMQEWLLHQWEHYDKTILFITHDVEEAVFLSQKIFVIQDRPFSSMEMVEVPLSYPRDRSDLKKPEVVELKEQLIGKLRRSVSL